MQQETKHQGLILQGIAATSGRACGRPFLLPVNTEKFDKTSSVLDIYDDDSKIETSTLTDTDNIQADDQWQKITLVFNELSKRYRQLQKKSENLGKFEEADILFFHDTVLADKDMQTEIYDLIHKRGLMAETAVSQIYLKQIQRFEQIDDRKLRARALDLYDILNNILILLKAKEDALVTDIPDNSIVIADDISPSQLVTLPVENIAGLICENGDPASHTAVMAAGLQIPAVFCCRGIIKLCSSNSTPGQILIDGTSGQVVIEPDDCQPKISSTVNVIDSQPAMTADGIKLELLANIISIQEYSRSKGILYDGTGLLRTETLFAGSSIAPDEELQYLRYSQAVKLAAQQAELIIIRTFDLAAGDKDGQLSIVGERKCSPRERGLSRSLLNPNELRTQLRAILRAYAGRECSILFPLVMSVDDFTKGVKLSHSIFHELKKERAELASSLKIGAMIETPEAVAAADKLFDLADFISIGSNDLASYTQGGLFTEDNMNMIRKLTSRSEIEKDHKQVIICGELAASPLLLPDWLNLGLRCFSININRMCEFKKAAAAINVSN